MGRFFILSQLIFFSFGLASSYACAFRDSAFFADLRCPPGRVRYGFERIGDFGGRRRWCGDVGRADAGHVRNCYDFISGEILFCCREEACAFWVLNGLSEISVGKNGFVKWRAICSDFVR